MKKLIGVCLLLGVFLFSSCSINLSQGPATTPIPTPVQSGAGQAVAVTPTVPRIPVTWGDLNLTGKLIYIGNTPGSDSSTMAVQSLDLKTGEISTIFQGPPNSWIYSVSILLSKKQLVMAYAPPSAQNKPTNPALYTMPLDGSEAPHLLFPPASADDEYLQPVWSPDGKTIYFSHFLYQTPSKNGAQGQNSDLYRLSYPDGAITKIASQAFWPNVSADSTHIVYVTIDPNDGTNKLYLANADGANARQVEMTADWVPSYIDAPIFSPDGESILYSAVSLSKSSASATWLEKLLGVTVVSAHSLPSDWWTVPVQGGTTTQLTHLQTTSLYASISPDKKYIACYSGAGLFLMQPDGTGVTMLVNGAGNAPSSVSWIP
jgi:Tol biopolymer transport system component